MFCLSVGAVLLICSKTKDDYSFIHKMGSKVKWCGPSTSLIMFHAWTLLTFHFSGGGGRESFWVASTCSTRVPCTCPMHCGDNTILTLCSGHMFLLRHKSVQSFKSCAFAKTVRPILDGDSDYISSLCTNAPKPFMFLIWGGGERAFGLHQRVAHVSHAHVPCTVVTTQF